MAYGHILGNTNELVRKGLLSSNYSNAFTVSGDRLDNNRLLTKSNIESNWLDSEANSGSFSSNRLLRKKNIFKPADGYIYKFYSQEYNPWRLSILLFEDAEQVWRNLALDYSDALYDGDQEWISSVEATVKATVHHLWTYGKLRSSFTDGDLYMYSNRPDQAYTTNVNHLRSYANEESGWESPINSDRIRFKNSNVKSATNDSQIMTWSGQIIGLMCFQSIWPNTSTNGSGSIHNDVNYLRFYDLGTSSTALEADSRTLSYYGSSIYNTNNYMKFCDDYIIKVDTWNNSTYNYTAYMNTVYNIYGPYRWMWTLIDLNHAYSFIMHS